MVDIKLPIANCVLVYGIGKQYHLNAEHGAGFDLNLFTQNQPV